MIQPDQAIEVGQWCVRCGWRIRPGAKYCANCGLRVALPALHRTAARPGDLPRGRAVWLRR